MSGRYIGKRCIQLIPILIAITFLSFTMMRLAGSDAVTRMHENSGNIVSNEILDKAKADLGLDKPFLNQYFSWLKGMMTGDMGTSYVTGKSVFQTFLSKLPATIVLALAAICLTIVISLPLGILAAVKEDTIIDRCIRFLSFAGNASPNFFVALLLMYVFCVRFKWVPVISQEITFQSTILPALTLAIAMSAKYIRQVRAAVLTEMEKDYVMGARARGIREGVILRKSVLRAAMLTILTLFALSIGSLLGGTAIVESIFMWDGVGKLAVDSITMRDYPMIQAYVVWMAILYVIINLLTDILYHYLDPRLRLGQEDSHDGNSRDGNAVRRNITIFTRRGRK